MYSAAAVPPAASSRSHTAGPTGAITIVRAEHSTASITPAHPGNVETSLDGERHVILGYN